MPTLVVVSHLVGSVILSVTAVICLMNRIVASPQPDFRLVSRYCQCSRDMINNMVSSCDVIEAVTLASNISPMVIES